jgi:hypothetical protein
LPFARIEEWPRYGDLYQFDEELNEPVNRSETADGTVPVDGGGPDGGGGGGGGAPDSMYGRPLFTTQLRGGRVVAASSSSAAASAMAAVFRPTALTANQTAAREASRMAARQAVTGTVAQSLWVGPAVVQQAQQPIIQSYIARVDNSSSQLSVCGATYNCDSFLRCNYTACAAGSTENTLYDLLGAPDCFPNYGDCAHSYYAATKVPAALSPLFTRLSSPPLTRLCAWWCRTAVANGSK